MQLKQLMVLSFLFVCMQLQPSDQRFELRDYDVLSYPGVMVVKDNKDHAWTLAPCFSAPKNFYDQVKLGRVAVQFDNTFYGYGNKFFWNEEAQAYEVSPVNWHDKKEFSARLYYAKNVYQVQKAMVQQCIDIDSQGWGGKNYEE